jgi:hypothetical protein
MMPDQTPIQIGSQTGEQLGQAVRVLLSAVAGWLVAKGWLDATIATAALPVLLIGIPIVWGQLRILITHGQRATMANLLPDTIATTK